MIQVTVAGMILDPQTRAPVLLLHLPPLNKYLPVWIGPSEAASIGMALKQERFERPLTHDLMVTIIGGLDGKVSKVTITELRNNTFFAKIFIARGDQVIGIDARPSDSIAVAIRTESPIFVAEDVIEKERDHLWSLDEGSRDRLFRYGDHVAAPEAEIDAVDGSAAPTEDPTADDDRDDDRSRNDEDKSK
jgi:bifunctional DNase/RNase